MENFEIKHGPLTNMNNQITGVIYLNLGGDAFPEKEWNDFVVVICNSWIDNNNLLQGLDEVDCTYRFMDGPLRFQLKGKGEKLLLSCYHRAKDIFSKEVLREEILVEIKRFAKSVLTECEKKHWDNIEIKQLKVKLS